MVLDRFRMFGIIVFNDLWRFMMLKWKKQTTGYSSILMSGRVPVGYAGYNDINKYSWKLSLPGKDRSGNTVSEGEARAACEAAFAEWMVAAGLQNK